jgi:bacillithiol system protein YtxJ
LARTIRRFEFHVNSKNVFEWCPDFQEIHYYSLPRLLSKLISLWKQEEGFDMANNFLRIQDQKSLDRLFSESKQRPILLFKHSNSCPISSRAYREMEKLDDVNLLEVQTACELSREVAAITGVRHETPQVIVLKDGRAVWNASHYDVNANSVSEALQANS